MYALYGLLSGVGLEDDEGAGGDSGVTVVFVVLAGLVVFTTVVVFALWTLHNNVKQTPIKIVYFLNILKI